MSERTTMSKVQTPSASGLLSSQRSLPLLVAAYATLLGEASHRSTILTPWINCGPSLIHKPYVIADVNVPARLTGHHRHAKGRLLLPKHRGQGGENRHVPCPGGGISMRRETPDFRPHHVKRHRADAYLAPHPSELFPGA